MFYDTLNDTLWKYCLLNWQSLCTLKSLIRRLQKFIKKLLIFVFKSLANC